VKFAGVTQDFIGSKSKLLAITDLIFDKLGFDFVPPLSKLTRKDQDQIS